MQDVANFIVDSLGFNQQIIGVIIPMCLVYLVLFWLMVCAWVFFDARKRYDNDFIALAFAVLNFLPPFNFLILLFYLVIRPDIRYDDFDDWEAGGVNVPIVNFMGTDGIEMSLELRVHPKKLGEANKSHDMSVEIGWDKGDEKFKLIDREELAKQVLGDDFVQEKESKTENEVKNIFSEVTGRVKKSVKYLQSRMSSMTQKKKEETKAEEKAEEKKDEEKKEVVEESKEEKDIAEVEEKINTTETKTEESKEEKTK